MNVLNKNIKTFILFKNKNKINYNYINMDNQRMEIANDIKQKLIEQDHIILDLYINENCYSIDYEIITNKNTIVLSIKMFYENGNSLFDELLIYDNRDNLLLEIPLNENHTLTKISEIFLYNFALLKM